MSKKIVVTGGAGFIGSHLVDRLISLGHQVLVIDDLSFGKKDHINDQADFIQLDIRDQKVFQTIQDYKPQIIYHLAAQKNVRTSITEPVYDADINILGALNILQAALASGVEKFIFVSTSGIYGEADHLPTGEEAAHKPMSPYILAKLTFENYLAMLASDKLSWLVLRLANVYGPRQDPHGEAGVIAVFLENLLSHKTLYINGDGGQTRDYIFVEDIVDILTLGLEKGQGIYNIGTGSRISLLELIKSLEKISGQRAMIEHRPAIQGEVRHSSLSALKAKDTFSWQPKHNLESGLQSTIAWFKNIIK